VIVMSTRGPISLFLPNDLVDSARTGALHPDLFQSIRSCTRTSGHFVSMPVHAGLLTEFAPSLLHDRRSAPALTALVGAKRGAEPCKQEQEM